MKKWMIAVVLTGMFILNGCANNVKDGVASLEAGNYEKAKAFFGKSVGKRIPARHLHTLW